MVDLDDIQPDQLQTKGSTIYKAWGCLYASCRVEYNGC